MIGVVVEGVALVALIIVIVCIVKSKNATAVAGVTPADSSSIYPSVSRTALNQKKFDQINVVDMVHGQ